MADQMTPDEMRETAERLRVMVFAMERLGETAEDERAGADSLDRLADVIEKSESEAREVFGDWLAEQADREVRRADAS